MKAKTSKVTHGVYRDYYCYYYCYYLYECNTVVASYSVSIV